jgi:hypothetical protein
VSPAATTLAASCSRESAAGGSAGSGGAAVSRLGARGLQGSAAAARLAIAAASTSLCSVGRWLEGAAAGSVGERLAVAGACDSAAELVGGSFPLSAACGASGDPSIWTTVALALALAEALAWGLDCALEPGALFLAAGSDLGDAAAGCRAFV